MTDEEKEILNNIKEYMQNDIDKGYHKFVYNDLGSDFKCIDCINAIDNVLNRIEKQSKEIKWKPIKDYDRKKYDWVLVKYFDGDYECVPEVAEKRSDGKWYTSERQIPFEVKYFFDMQKILKEE